MTAKQKASDLCMMFLIKTTTEIPYGVNKTIAKECALILVNEVLESNNTLLKLESIGVVFWEQVKLEIEKL